MEPRPSRIEKAGVEGRDINTAAQVQAGERFRRAPTRARAACQVCRWKKVRCDARDGNRCSNCKFDDVQCVMLSKRSRRKSTVAKATRPSPQPPANAESSTAQSEILGTQGMTTSDRQPRSSPLTSKTPLFATWTSSNLARPIFPPTSFDRSSQHSALSPNSDPQDLPHYIKPLPASLGADDIDYLRKKGAFIIPEPQLRDECLKGYLQNIHTLYPLVDFAKIQSIINGTKQDSEKLSLLLLQALIFAGCTWVDVRLIRNLGFLTRKSFRQSMQKKIRLLYDADYEEDKFCLVQSLILWSFWWKGTNETKDPMHFLATAQSVARTIDLHKSVSDLSMNSALQRLRRRVWWSLVIRDTIGSFGLSRAPKIKTTDHGVPMLRLDDFDLQDPDSEVSLPVFAQAGAQKRLFARICIEHAKLVQIFCKILNEACPEGGAGRTAGLFTSQQMEGSNDMSLRSHLNIEYLNSYEKELMSWRQKLPEELWHNGPLPFSLAEWDKAELALKGYLSMMFYTALMTLHRPQMLTTAERTGQDLSRATVRYAAQEITAIGMDFFRADLVTTLSASCISCLMPASINHVFDVFSDNATIRSEASQRLDQCKSILQGFSEQQFAASWVLCTIDHILNRAQQKNKLIPSSGTEEGVDAHSISAMASNRGLESLVAANHLTPSAISLSNTDSLAGVTLTNVSGHSADSTSYPPNPDDQYWASLFGNQNGVGNAQLPYLLSGQGFSDEGSNIEALEEMWSDFVRVSETSVGSGWTNGNF